MIRTLCAKFRKQNHPNNTLLLTWAVFLSHFRPTLHDLYIYIILCIYIYIGTYIIYKYINIMAPALFDFLRFFIFPDSLPYPLILIGIFKSHQRRIVATTNNEPRQAA